MAKTRRRRKMDDETLKKMALAVWENLPRADALLVAKVGSEHPQRMAEAIRLLAGYNCNAEEFAAYVLRSARRILESVPS